MAPLTLSIKLQVKLLQSVEVDSETTVAEFKEILAPVADVPANQQRLIHRGHLLKDEKKLSEYGAASQHSAREWSLGARGCGRHVSSRLPACGELCGAGPLSRQKDVQL